MRHSAMLILLLVTSLTAAILAEPCTQGLTVVAPRVAVAGQGSSVLVTLHGSAAREPLNVTLRLAAELAAEEEAPEILAQSTALLRGHGLVHLAVPLSAAGKPAVLQVLANCSSQTESDDCALSANCAMQVAHRVREVIIRSDKPRYRPGETVNFWLVAVDHELRPPYDVTADVCVRDSAGNKVALWSNVGLGQGVRSFSLELADTAMEGSWQLEVKVTEVMWSHVVNVSHISWPDSPQQAMAEEHYVELRFGHEMRRLYKPGLPFVGKVEAVSTERSMRVRVKVYDNTTAIYSQDIEISSGEGTFLVPAILADSDVIVFQAELVSVEGKEIDSHYVLAKEPIRKWNSSSDCYILIEGLEQTMKPGEQAHAVILSTCPCERDLHVVVTTDGHVTHAAERHVDGPVTSQEIPTQSVDGVAICHVNFSLPVSSEMAPVSHLLVYYVTDEGEPVSDVTSFGVQLTLQEMTLNIEQRNSWSPGEAMDAQLIGAQEGDVICLIGDRAQDLEPKHLARSKPQKPVAEPPALPTGDLDFQEAGVSLYQRACSHGHVVFRQDGTNELPKVTSLWSGTEHKSGSDIWLWHCRNYTAAVAAVGVTVRAPQRPGAWSLWSFSLSSRSGLRFSPPQHLTVFQPLDTSLALPPTMKVGEAVEVSVKIANNLNTCMDVTALLSLTEGAHFLSNHVLYLSEKLRLGPLGATSLIVRVVATKVGPKNLTAEVSGYSSDSCQGVPGDDELVSALHERANDSLVASVTRVVSTSVLAEGLLKTSSESAYFCANENLLVSPVEDFQFEFVSAPHTGLVFEVKSATGALIALSDVRYVSSNSYLINLGNQESWLGRGRHEYGLHLTSAKTTGLLSNTEFKAFWVSWDRGVVAIGEGHVLHNTTLLQWPLEGGLVTHVGFASAWGQPAQFRVWSYNEEAGFSQVLHMDVPAALVPGTEQGMLLIAGGLYLPSQDTLRSGKGGLHGALNALSTLYSLRMREATGEAGPAEREAELRDVRPRLQRLMAFRTNNGAFGDHPDIPDFRSSVSALETLVMLQSYMEVDPEIMTSLKHWLLSQQQEDGSFSARVEQTITAEGKEQLSNSNDDNDASREGARAKVGTRVSDESVYLTGQAIVALIRLGLESAVDTGAVMRARYYLERAVFHVSEPRALALLALALTRGHSEMSSAALDRLRHLASNEEGDFAWPLNDNSTKPLDRDVSEFEASLWTLITYTSQGDLKSAEPVAKFLFYRWALLDTHTELLGLAVRAAAQFSLLGRDVHRQLTVSLATSGMELTDTLELRPDTPGPARLLLPGLPTRVFVYSTGAGCATIKGVVTCSTYEDGAGRSHSLLLWSAVVNENLPRPNSLQELEERQPSVQIRSCVQWLSDNDHGPVRLEIELFSGFELETVDNKSAVWHGAHAQNVWFVFDKVSADCARCVLLNARAHSVVRSLRPALARAFPAGRPHEAAQLFFHARKDSPLLAGVAEDDLVTWFGHRHADDILGSNMTEVCECPCQSGDTSTSTSSPATASQPITTVLPSTQSPSPATSTEATTKIPTTLETTTNATPRSTVQGKGPAKLFSISKKKPPPTVSSTQSSPLVTVTEKVKPDV